MRKCDAPLAGHLRQQAKTLHPQRDRDEMRCQDEMTPLRLRRAQHRQHRHHHGKQADCAHGNGNRRLHGGGTRAKHRDQDDLRRSRPDQERAEQHPQQAEMRVMRQRADTEIGRKQHQRQHGRGDGAHPPRKGAGGTFPVGRVEWRQPHGMLNADAASGVKRGRTKGWHAEVPANTSGVIAMTG